MENFIFCVLILLVLEKAVTNLSRFRNLLPYSHFTILQFLLFSLQVLVLGIDKVKYMD